MPKTRKRTETKRAARIAKAHATELPKLEVREPQERKRAPGYKPPTRGIARYPWAIVITLGILIVGGIGLYSNHIWPFTLPKPQPHPKVAATPFKFPAVSPCLNTNVIKQITDTSSAPNQAAFNKIQHTYTQAPAMTIDAKKVYCAGINTNRGLIVLELDPQLAPHTVNNFVFLAQNKFYDGIVFHRVIQSGTGLHIIQTGDPLGSDPQKRGTGGPGYKFADEPVLVDYTAGTVAMANSGANSNGSQFFINLQDNSKGLQKSYNLFGRVVQGMDVTAKIQGPGDDATTKNITPDVMNHVIIVPAP